MLPIQANSIKVSVNIILLGYIGNNGTLEGSIIAKTGFSSCTFACANWYCDSIWLYI